MHDQQRFESFRRERNKRRMESGPLRPLGQNAQILREIEEADAKEARNQRLTREVHEFFADATRTAATIVSQVAETAEAQLQQSVTQEMAEFLAATIRRAQQFVELMRTTGNPNIASQEISANLSNIVGPMLDEFRFEGDVSTAEQHVGQDPFSTDLPDTVGAPPIAVPQGALPGRVSNEPARGPLPIEDHLVAQDDEDTLESSAANSPLAAWFERLRKDDESARNALKMLVRAELMTKDEARAIYRGA